MTTRWLVVVVAAMLCGCSNGIPTWSKAGAEARQSGMFIPDDAYYASQQFTNDTAESANTVLKIRRQLGRDKVEDARTTLNARLSLQQKVAETNAVQAQQAWLAQTFAASPNVSGKITTMIDPINSKGQIMEHQIITYYDGTTMRYATNTFDRAKLK